MENLRQTILTDKLAMPLVAVVGAFIVIAPGIMWASNLTARTNGNDQQIVDLKARIVDLERAKGADATRVTILETNYATILSSFVEIKQSLSKIEARFNLR